MKTYPNQKTVTTHKTDLGGHFIAYNYDVICNAFQNLKPSACILWMYFSKNKDNSTFAISKSNVQKCFGITPQQYRTAIQELMQKKYLIKKPNTKNHYEFYDTPLNEKQNNKDDDQWRYDLLPL